MSDPRRPNGSDPNRQGWSQPTEPVGNWNSPYTDPAYAGQYNYPGYAPQNPTQQLPPYWTQTQQPSQQPPGGKPPKPPRSPRWLWLAAGAAVVLVLGMVIALVITDGTSKRDTVVAPLPPMAEPTATTAPTTTRTPASTQPRTTTPSTPPTPSIPILPPTNTVPGVSEAVVYTVNGEGRAISITYVDAGGVLQMEFNVVLPWSKVVSLSSPASSAASVTVLNVGREVTCTVSVDGMQVQERTGTGLTICASR
ncbi:MAG: MmpS family transport accessory protein [Mycobacterium sp.]